MKLRRYKNPRNVLISLLCRLPECRMVDKWLLSLVFRRIFGRSINWKHPQSYSEKLQWLKIYNRREVHTTMADKFAAKQWIADRIGNEYIIPTLGVWSNFDEIDFSLLPSQFVLKTTHDCGGIVVVKDKSRLDFHKARLKLESSLSRNFYKYFREWPYKNILPQIIGEAYLEDSSGDLKDYKFYCFNGEPKIMYIAQGFGNPLAPHVIDYFDMEYNHLPLTRHYPMAEIVPEKPENWIHMKEIAKILSKDEIFLRVDFYEVNGKLYMGELTFFPGAGLEVMKPEEWDYRFGQWLKLPFEQ